MKNKDQHTLNINTSCSDCAYNYEIFSICYTFLNRIMTYTIYIYIHVFADVQHSDMTFYIKYKTLLS